MSLTRRSFLASSAGLAAAAAAGSAGVFAPTAAANPAAAAPVAGAWQSALLKVKSDGRLVYPKRDGMRLPDFGSSGYAHGERPIPGVPVVETVGPIPGDNTAHLKDAIDRVGALPLDENGIRGALLLTAGIYELDGTLTQPHSGVVLRGVGDGADPASNTILRPRDVPDSARNGIIVGGTGSWNGQVPGTRTDIVTGLVAVADREFTVADAANLSVGDTIIITHPCTQAWLDAVDGGGTATDAPWSVGQLPIVYNRRITAIRGKRVTIDVPVFNQLDRSLSQSYLYVWDRAGLVTNVGVEDLRIDAHHDGDDHFQNTSHSKHNLRLRMVEDAWVRRCTSLHFSQSGYVTGLATRITVQDCRSWDPVATLDGSMRYNFNVEARSQQILFTDCHTTHSRHAFVSNGTSTVSGMVIHRTTARYSNTASEGHRQWSQGILFDNHTEIEPKAPRTVSLYNRGDYGTGHGWSAAHSVAWNTDTAGTELTIQRPPTAQNYGIGCRGDVTGVGPYTQPAGWIEGANRPGLVPESLYEAQLAARLRG